MDNEIIEEIFSKAKERLSKTFKLAEEEVPADDSQDSAEEAPAEDFSSKSLIEVLEGKEDGSYTITTILQEGKVTEAEVHSVEAPAEEDEVETELAEEDEAPAESSEEAPADDESKTEEIKNKTIADIIDLSKNGYYNISVSVQEGVITWGSVTTEAYEELSKEEKLSLKLELSEEGKEELNAEIEKVLTDYKEELSAAFEANLTEEKEKFEAKLSEVGKTAGESKLKQAPAAEKEDVKLSKVEILKRRILEDK